eukprot:1147859-Rhodomonas_salina.2
MALESFAICSDRYVSTAPTAVPQHRTHRIAEAVSIAHLELLCLERQVDAPCSRRRQHTACWLSALHRAFSGRPPSHGQRHSRPFDRVTPDLELAAPGARAHSLVETATARRARTESRGDRGREGRCGEEEATCGEDTSLVLEAEGGGGRVVGHRRRHDPHLVPEAVPAHQTSSYQHALIDNHPEPSAHPLAGQ